MRDLTTSAPGRVTRRPLALSARARSFRLLAVAVALPYGFLLSSCFSQENSSRRAYSPAEKASLASDEPVRHRATDENEGMDYDPWEPVNERTFDFNFNVLDRYALKPAAEVWARALPQSVRHGLANMFDNLGMPKRFVNKVLQGRLPGAGEEIGRFVLNTTVGVVGFFDVAAHVGLHRSDADTGQTLGTYGIKPGPYLVLPILPPLDVRDAIGFVADSFLDPLSWFVTPIGADIGRSAAYTINERADHMTEYDDVEDTSLDLYAAVRNGYLQRRQKFITDAIGDRDRDWGIIPKRSHRQGGASLDDTRPYDDGALLDIPGE
jgi:phospholipid-binding lipoprotein MlaA